MILRWQVTFPCSMLSVFIVCLIFGTILAAVLARTPLKMGI